MCIILCGWKAAVKLQWLPQQSAFWSMIACVNVSVGYWFPGGLLCAGFIRLARWQAHPSECLIKVQLTLPAKGRGAISLPICSAKALPNMFFCSYSSACHPGSHQCTDPNTPAFSEPPGLILGRTRLQHKQSRPAWKPGMESLQSMASLLQNIGTTFLKNKRQLFTESVLTHVFIILSYSGDIQFICLHVFLWLKGVSFTPV